MTDQTDQFEDPDDTERAEVHLRITGPQDVTWGALIEWEHYVDETPGLECGREEQFRDADGVDHILYTPVSGRAGVVGPAIERLCATLRLAEPIHARIHVPGWSRAFHGGWERDYLVSGVHR